MEAIKPASNQIPDLLKYDHVVHAYGFGVTTLAVAVGTRISAWVYRESTGRLEGAHFFLSAGAVILAAAGLLRELGLTAWSSQAPLLMLLPIAYIIGSRVWRGRSPERPLGAVAHTAAALILIHVLCSSVDIVRSIFDPVEGEVTNLLLGLVFAEAAVFYVLAGLFRRRGVNAYFATAAACGALWQLLGYFSVSGTYHSMLYAGLGLILLGVARSLGLKKIPLYQSDGVEGEVLRGRGLTAYQSGNAILTVAFLAAGLHGLSRLLSSQIDGASISGLVLTTVASIVAIFLVPRDGSRRFYTTTSIGLAGLMFVTVSIGWLVGLSGWQKLELFGVTMGLALLVGSHVARFRESGERPNDTVSFGLFLGSALATLPLLIAVFHHRFLAESNSMQPTLNDFAILSVSIVMLVTGLSWQLRSTTLFGAACLTLTLIVLITSMAYQALAGVGAFLAIGGGTLFGLGIALSVYRDKLLAIPDQIANRQGLFRVMNWR